MMLRSVASHRSIRATTTTTNTTTARTRRSRLRQRRIILCLIRFVMKHDMTILIQHGRRSIPPRRKRLRHIRLVESTRQRFTSSRLGVDRILQRRLPTTALFGSAIRSRRVIEQRRELLLIRLIDTAGNLMLGRE